MLYKTGTNAETRQNVLFPSILSETDGSQQGTNHVYSISDQLLHY
jgi:hypothetical protein